MAMTKLKNVLKIAALAAIIVVGSGIWISHFYARFSHMITAEGLVLLVLTTVICGSATACAITGIQARGTVRALRFLVAARLLVADFAIVMIFHGAELLPPELRSYDEAARQAELTPADLTVLGTLPLYVAGIVGLCLVKNWGRISTRFSPPSFSFIR